MDNALEHSSLPPTTPPPSSLPPSLRDRRDSSNGNWREEEASLRHQLRLLRAELASWCVFWRLWSSGALELGRTSLTI